MATHNSDINLLCDLAFSTQGSDAVLSGALYRILGLSVRLGPRLNLARTRRRLDPTRDSKSQELYHRIIWMSREGLAITEEYIVPHVQNGGFGHDALDRDLKIFAAKLRASFYHIFCLFHNTPPVTTLPPTISGESPPGNLKTGSPASSPFSPRSKRHSNGSNGRSRVEKSRARDTQQPLPRSRDRTAALRDAIPSMASEASYVTNPYSNPALSPPPGLPHPTAFLLPVADYRPVAEGAFKTALALADQLLPGSAPLKLSIALEYSAFLWDCNRDHTAARNLARHTIRAVYRESSPMEDDEFEDAALFVGALGRMMRRKSAEATPKLGAESPARDAGTAGIQAMQNSEVPPLPPKPDPPPKDLPKVVPTTASTTLPEKPFLSGSAPSASISARPEPQSPTPIKSRTP